MKFLKVFDLDSDFFKRYISLIQSTGKVKTGTQIVSAVTSFAVWYALANSNLVAFFGWWSFIPSVIFGVVVAVGIEVGLRKFLPYGVQVFLYKRSKGLDLAMSVFIIPICLFLLMATGYTSFKGSTTVVESFAPDIELLTTTATDSAYTSILDANKQTFASDSLVISTTFNQQITATSTKYDTKITAALNEAEQLKDQAFKSKSKGNKNWLNVLASRATDKVDNLTFEKDSIVADLERFKAVKLLTLLDNRRNDKVQADTTHQAATTKIITSNETAQAESDQLINSYGSGLGWITIVCLIVFIFLTILEEIHRKGSDQSETVVFDQLDLLPSIWDRWTNYINAKVLGKVHRKLNEWESNLQPLPMPEPVKPIYIQGPQEQKQIEIKEPTTLPRQSTKPKKDLYQLFGVDNIEGTDFSKNNSTDEIISATIEYNDPTTPISSEDSEERANIVPNDLVNELFNGSDYNDPTNDREGDTICDLDGCNELFRKKNHRHIFCCNEHRIKSWEGKKGRKLHK